MSVSSQTKRALVIGIGEQEDKNWGKINGDNDVRLIRPVLSKTGFTDVKYLINRNATKKNIIKAFEDLIKRSTRGDVVYVHFSGHGQQINDFNKDEEDNRDECWIPYDAYLSYCKKDDGSHHLTDDEINNILYDIKQKIGRQGKLLVVVDACHSGDSSRGSDDTITYRGTRDMFFAPLEINVSPLATEREEWIILSACQDYQRNAELRTSKGQYGKLTYALFNILAKGDRISNKELYDRLCRFFDNNRGVLQQTPVMKGVTKKFKITEIF